MTLVTTLIVATLIASPTTPAVTNRAQYLMGTVCEIALPESPDAARQAAAGFAEAERVEALISTWRDTTELARLNRGEIHTVSSELAQLLGAAIDWSKKTNGAFNPLVAPLVDLWHTRAAGSLPNASDIAAAREKAALANVEKRGRRIMLRNGATFEEGGFGKGYALDRMRRYLPPSSMIDFGGQVLVKGRLAVAVAAPDDRDHPVIELTLRDETISTSSGSEKTFVADGRTFSHIFDPRTGEALPPRGSVSVIAASAMTADVLSTALYVMGVDEGLRWADEHGIEAIFITPEHHVRVSAAVRKRARVIEVLDPDYKLKD